jgi:hypothetical protein
MTPPTSVAKGKIRFAWRDYQRLYTSAVGLLASLLAIISFVTGQTTLRPPSTKSQLQELEQVRQALHALDGYVEAQQRTIVTSEATLAELRRQKAELDKVVSINADAARALLQYQEKRQTQHLWLGYAISFILGIFSSLTATFSLEIIRKRNTTKAATAKRAQ